MAYYDEPAALDFDAREAALVQQQARVKAMRELAMQQVQSPGEAPGWTSAVTGTRIGGKTLKTPTAALLSPLINQVGADYGDSRIVQGRSLLGEDQRVDLQDIINSIPKARQEELGPDEPRGSFVGDPSMAIAQMTDPVERERAMTAWRNQQAGNMRTVQPTQAEMLGSIGRMQANPLARTLAAKTLEDQLFTRPTKEDERAFQSSEKALDRGSVLTAAVMKARADAADKAAQRAQSETNARIVAGARAASTANASEGTFSIVPGVVSSNNLPVERNNKTGQTREVQPAPGSTFEPPVKPAKPLPVEAGKAWRENNKSIGTIDEALNQLKANPDSTGILKGAIAGIPGVGQNLVNKWDPGGLEARALVSNIGSMVIHDRSGATVTAAETPRLRPFIPNATDSATEAARKLRLFKAEYQKMQQEIKDYAESQGYKDPGKITGVNTGGATGDFSDQPGGLDPSKMRIIRSKEERDALPPDTPYMDGQGNVARTPKRK